jgi:hypothetical protein
VYKSVSGLKYHLEHSHGRKLASSALYQPPTWEHAVWDDKSDGEDDVADVADSAVGSCNSSEACHPPTASHSDAMHLSVSSYEAIFGMFPLTDNVSVLKCPHCSCLQTTSELNAHLSACKDPRPHPSFSAPEEADSPALVSITTGCASSPQSDMAQPANCSPLSWRERAQLRHILASESQGERDGLRRKLARRELSKIL